MSPVFLFKLELWSRLRGSEALNISVIQYEAHFDSQLIGHEHAEDSDPITLFKGLSKSVSQMSSTIFPTVDTNLFISKSRMSYSSNHAQQKNGNPPIGNGKTFVDVVRSTEFRLSK